MHKILLNNSSSLWHVIMHTIYFMYSTNSTSNFKSSNFGSQMQKTNSYVKYLAIKMLFECSISSNSKICPNSQKTSNYTVVQKNWIVSTFSNNFNRYWSISIIFGRRNLQKLSNVHICNLIILIKQGTSLGQFHYTHFILCVKKLDPCIIVINY